MATLKLGCLAYSTQIYIFLWNCLGNPVICKNVPNSTNNAHLQTCINDYNKFIAEIPKGVKDVIHQQNLELPTGSRSRSLTPTRGEFIQVDQEEANSKALERAGKHEDKKPERCDEIVEVVEQLKTTALVDGLVEDLVSDVSGEEVESKDHEDYEHFNRFTRVEEGNVIDITDIISRNDKR